MSHDINGPGSNPSAYGCVETHCCLCHNAIVPGGVFKLTVVYVRRPLFKEDSFVIRIRNYPKKQGMALPVEWRNKTAKSPDCVVSIVIASRLSYHHFMVAATG